MIGEGPDRSYIAFVDDRQPAERSAAGIEATCNITEEAIIVESRYAMAFRSGLMRRERIEEALRAGDIRGIASTSAVGGPAPLDTALGGDLLSAVKTPALVVVVVGQVLGNQLQAVIASGHGLWLVGVVGRVFAS